MDYYQNVTDIICKMAKKERHCVFNSFSRSRSRCRELSFAIFHTQKFLLFLSALALSLLLRVSFDFVTRVPECSFLSLLRQSLFDVKVQRKINNFPPTTSWPCVAAKDRERGMGDTVPSQDSITLFQSVERKATKNAR